MAYTEFTPENVGQRLGVTVAAADLFPGLTPVPVPGWLVDWLARTRPLAWVSEKSRGEFVVVPVLVAARDLTGGRFDIFSGPNFVVDPARGLNGECDFILSPPDPLAVIRAPAFTIIEAKRHDVEGATGQCVAQMVAARVFNERNGLGDRPVYGCVTNADDWQFLRLTGTAVEVHHVRLYLGDLGRILAALVAAVDQALGGPPH